MFSTLRSQRSNSTPSASDGLGGDVGQFSKVSAVRSAPRTGARRSGSGSGRRPPLRPSQPRGPGPRNAVLPPLDEEFVWAPSPVAVTSRRHDGLGRRLGGRGVQQGLVPARGGDDVRVRRGITPVLAPGLPGGAIPGGRRGPLSQSLVQLAVAREPLAGVGGDFALVLPDRPTADARLLPGPLQSFSFYAVETVSHLLKPVQNQSDLLLHQSAHRFL